MIHAYDEIYLGKARMALAWMFDYAVNGCRIEMEDRKWICLSQKELAEKANVPLRTIQQYEQKQKNINHARADYVIRLAKALYCRPEDLLEVETLQ